MHLRFDAARRAVVMGCVVSIAACGPSSSQIRAILEDSHKREMTEETDPDARAYLEGYYQCVKDDNAEAVERRIACLGENETKTIASLKGQIASANPSTKEALTRAVTCVESTKKMVVPDGGPKIGYPNEVKSCLASKRLTVTVAAKEQDDEFTAAEKTDTADAWLAFIAKHKEDKRVSTAVKRVVVASTKATGDARSQIEEKLVTTYPAGLAELPADRRILLVGPKGLRIVDLVKLKDAKVSPNIVIARVKASTEPYKNFEADELGALKQLGIADDIVAAMIEVTAKLEERKKADEEKQALRAELAALRAMIEEKKAAGAKGGETVQTKEGPMDVLASCGKRLAAMKLCEQIPFPGGQICKGTAESEFPCPQK